MSESGAMGSGFLLTLSSYALAMEFKGVILKGSLVKSKLKHFACSSAH